MFDIRHRLVVPFGRRMRLITVATALICSVIVLAHRPAHAATLDLYVATTGSGSSCTQLAPCQRVQTAIDIAVATRDTATTIHVAAGTYAQTLNLTRSFDYQGPITIVGQGPALTTLASSGGRVLNVDGYSRSPTTISHVAIAGGNANGTHGGGARLASGGPVVLSNVVIRDNVATYDGGGLLVESNQLGTVSLIDSTVMNNTAGRGGGGILSAGTGLLDITRSTISGNMAWHSQPAGGGGGILNKGSLKVNDSTIAGNRGLTSGGGLFNWGTATLDRVTVSSNTTNGAGAGVANGWGGDTGFGTLTVTNSTVSDNLSSTYGGGIWSYGSNTVLTVQNSTLFANTGEAAGGGLYLYYSKASLTENTFSRNASPSGSAIFQLAGPAIGVARSIFSNNSCAANILSGGYNVESGTTCGRVSSDLKNSTTINIAPALAPNGSTGPMTLSITPTSSAFQRIPLQYSDFEVTGRCATSDQRGMVRPGHAGENCSAGAYEFQPTPTTTSVSSSMNPSTFGDPISLTATPTPSDGTGRVAFFANGTAIAGCSTVSLSLIGGVHRATCTTSALNAGTYAITAKFSKSAYYGPSTGSLPEAQIVQRARPVIETTPTSLSAAALERGSAQFTARVTRSGSGVPIVGHNVTFYAGNTFLCSSTTNASGVGTCNSSVGTMPFLIAEGKFTARTAQVQNYESASADGALVP